MSNRAKVLVKSCLPRLVGGTARTVVTALIVLASSTPVTAARAIPYWQHTPYRIRVLVAVEAPGQLRELLEDKVSLYLQQRADAVIGPMWRLDITVAKAAMRHRLLTRFSSLRTHDVIDDLAECDKLLVLAINHEGNGFRLRAREYDTYVERWSRPNSDFCRQEWGIPERAFQLLWQTFAPLVRIELDPENEEVVRLELRGDEIATRDPDAAWIQPGDVFLPILRRTTRDGEVIEGGIQVVPWTFLEIRQRQEDRIVAAVISGTSSPLGVRRRGRVEQLAIALRNRPAPLWIHLHSRTDDSKDLAGYEVHTQSSGEKSLRLLGLTDDKGRLRVPAGETPVQYLFLKNGGQLLARVPVVCGSRQVLDIPLPDDDPRLQAEAVLNALREELIDLVARRQILIARVRRRMGEADFDHADDLLDELDQLPGRAQFDRELTKQQQLHRSADPQVQQQIDKLFADTRVVLGQFLDARTLTELRDELNAAKRTGETRDADAQTAMLDRKVKDPQQSQAQESQQQQ